ncbi:cwfJ family protein [Heterostelium album PN500]|uniref:CwfJ family protein n=1 Tax=Heterostelium pallidum (strain ATCC 26659 / Pp 5 / PN500) TaxID=670386 RepID=D3B2Y5_HETP5|nr:cwfJ family protein [Heterostelium album PN500]EFA83683.1 cwfJ family protein [Heterostelium album PN500]|eukprot:XP_020435800.1 cwfJ family protein [Heterostelium album PN500]
MSDDDDDEWVEAPTTTDHSSQKEKKHKEKNSKKKHKEKNRDRDRDRERERGDNHKKRSKQHKNDDDDDVVDDSKKKLKIDNNDSKDSDNATGVGGSGGGGRDDWMNMESSSWLSGSKSHNDVKRELMQQAKDEKNALADKLSKTAGLVDPELFMKQHQQQQQQQSTDKTTTTATAIPTSSKSDTDKSFLVGDGGASWRAKKLLRAQQQASESGESVNTVLKERLSENEIENITKTSNKNNYSNYNKNSNSQRSNNNPRDYLRKEEDDNISLKMKKPSNDSKLFWSPGSNRRHSSGEHTDRDTYDRDRRDRDRDRDRDRERSDRDRDRDRSNRDRDRDRDRDYKDRDRGDNDKKRDRDYRDGDRDRDYKNRDRDRDNDKKRDGDYGDKDKVKEIKPVVEVVRTEQPSYAELFPHLAKNKVSEKEESKKNQNEDSPSSTTAAAVVTSTTSTTSTTRSTNTTTTTTPINLNKLNAEMLKAKMMGDKNKMEKLQKQIDEYKEQQQQNNNNNNNNNERKENENRIEGSNQVKISGLDEFGKKIYMKESTSKLSSRQEEHFDKNGERLKYYDDDDKVDLDTLVAREKRGTAGNMDYEFLNTISKAEKWAQDDRDDYGPEMQAGSKQSKRRQQEKESRDVDKFKQQLVNSDRRVNSALERCWHCPASKQYQRHMTIATGHHMSNDATSAPAFFKKALMESESEWSNNRLIDSVKKGGLRNSIPQNFSYFWVECGYKQVGFVHPIENEIKFQRDFGKNVIAGMLDLDLDELHSKRKSYQEEERYSNQFKSQFSDFDWTKQLE